MWRQDSSQTFTLGEMGIPWLAVLSFLMAFGVAAADEKGHPLPEKQRQELKESLEKRVSSLTAQIKEKPDSVSLYSQRGDAFFFLAKFKEAVSDYEKMVELDATQDSSHWRRGIARFYAEEYKKAAHQFEIYDTFDDVDRENGIWRYFSQYKAYGAKKAKEGLLKYKKDDREPFPSVYQLFSGELTADEVLAAVKDAEISKTERSKREFYAFLYVGLNDAVEGRDAAAFRSLRAATANTWGPEAGFGPNYMWHVGRIHYELLLKKRATAEKKKKASQPTEASSRK
jgi:lipoprotein NlpI